jgi:hypothetical protein
MSTPARAFIMNRIASTFPAEILRVTFKDERNQVSIDHMIMEDIIKPKVLFDINSKTGRSTMIPLKMQWLEPADPLDTGFHYDNNNYSYYRIPEEARYYSNINFVRRVVPGPGTTYMESSMGYSNTGWSNNLARVAEFGVASRFKTDMTMQPRAQLLNDNIVSITPRLLTDGYLLVCSTEYDNNFTNCPTGALQALANLVLHQIKRHIWIKNVITIGAGRIVAGMALDAYKDIVDSYGQDSSDERYTELLDRFVGSNMLNNPKDQSELLSLRLGG